MDGIEFLRHVWKIEGKVPFVLFTGKGREEVAINAFNNGADFYLKKEGSPTVMYAELANMIERSTVGYRLESQLREKTELLAQAEKMGMMGCWEYDFIKKQFGCSEETLEILKRPESFLIQSILEAKSLVVDGDLYKITEMMKAARSENRSTSNILKINNFPNDIKTIYIKIKPVTDSSGKVFKIICIIRDITDERGAHPRPSDSC